MNIQHLFANAHPPHQPHALILGSGYVGNRFAEHLQCRDIPYRQLSRRMIDYTIPGQLDAFLQASRPDFVINAAGFTGRPNIDACEDARDECLFGNTILPTMIRGACEHLDIPWGHVSTGCIYSGRRKDGEPFDESDSPNFSFEHRNCNFYSGSKALGEKVLSGAHNCYIWRLRLPFDNRDSSRNYLSKLLRFSKLLESENSISHLDDFVDAALQCWLKNVPFGTYNIVNPGPVTTSQVTELLQSHRLLRKAPAFFDSDREFLLAASRIPKAQCVLSTRKLIAAGVNIRSTVDALEDAMSRWIPAQPRLFADPAAIVTSNSALAPQRRSLMSA